MLLKGSLEKLVGLTCELINVTASAWGAFAGGQIVDCYGLFYVPFVLEFVDCVFFALLWSSSVLHLGASYELLPSWPFSSALFCLPVSGARLTIKKPRVAKSAPQKAVLDTLSIFSMSKSVRKAMMGMINPTPNVTMGAFLVSVMALPDHQSMRTEVLL